MAAGAPGASAAMQRLTYDVHHSSYGDIGLYTNSVERDGGTATVTTDAHIRVSILGVVLYRQDVARTERWNRGRLVSFHGVTNVNGRAMTVNGMAEADRFLVQAPGGSMAAPADVRIANPWSADVLKGKTILTPDRGQLEDVQVGGGEETQVQIGKAMVQAKHYTIARSDGRKHYNIWLDASGTPVMFNVQNPNNTVTFTLER
jgi:hypothetical protein